MALARLLLCLLLFVTPLVSACMPVRPVIKIGLLASFEGLYRRNGYEALRAMRLAIDVATIDVATNGSSSQLVAVIPLAMDSGVDGEDARRVAQKLLRDPDLKAVVGPYDPMLIEAIRPLIEAQQLPWFLPFAIDPTVGMTEALPTVQWAEAMIRAIAGAAAAQGQQRLVLAGQFSGWPAAETLIELDVALPLERLHNVNATEDALVLSPDDALLWLGDVASGAAYLEEIRQFHPAIPFWLGPWGDDPVFFERTTSRHAVYWISWVDERYDLWQKDASLQGVPTSPTAYLTYRATEAVLASVGYTVPSAAPSTWRRQVFTVNDAGIY